MSDLCMNCFKSPGRCQCECGFVEFTERVEAWPSEDRIIADLKAELEQQRTRAEAAEQELREDLDRRAAAVRKLAAIRAHLAGVDVAKLGKMAKKAHEGPWGFWPNYGITPNKEKYGSGCTLSLDGDGKKPGPDTAFVIAIRNAADALLAAAREALEP